MKKKAMVLPPFVDRETELATLERAWQSGRAELVVLYGRRRIGKTALLREFMKGKPGTCKPETLPFRSFFSLLRT